MCDSMSIRLFNGRRVEIWHPTLASLPRRQELAASSVANGFVDYNATTTEVTQHFADELVELVFVKANGQRRRQPDKLLSRIDLHPSKESACVISASRTVIRAGHYGAALAATVGAMRRHHAFFQTLAQPLMWRLASTPRAAQRRDRRE
jgi:hypothetical protein